MTRLMRGPVPLALLLAALLGGCNHGKKNAVRPAPQSSEMLTHPAEDPSLTRPDELANFFKPTRNQGTWSSEAREVESSLGVHR